jgi:endonuclease-3
MYNKRTKTLKEISQEILTKYDGNLNQVFDQPFALARDELMELPGVGPKTADVALMFVKDREVIPVDRHIERIAKRWEIIESNAEYEEIRRILEDTSSPERYKEVHLSMIRFGREVCSALNPKCFECILKDLCPYPSKNN